jgi:CRP-like cAMP-binding protein
VPVSTTAPAPIANRLLAALPAADLARLRPNLEPVALIFKKEYAEAGAPVDHVYFPFRGVMSLLVPMPHGGTVEVALVGNEGLVGIHAYLGNPVSPFSVICQVPGNGVRMTVTAFQKEVQRGGALAVLLSRFLEGLLIQMAVTGACNRLHEVEQRCARWMLMTHDRVDGADFTLTQEFLAKMLGIRRAGVNAVASSFKQNGIIRYSRGKITVVKRAALEAMACDCYTTLQQAGKRAYSSR